MGWLGVTLKQVLTRVRAGGWRCHWDVITVRDDTGWQGAGDVTHRKHAEVCVRIWRKQESGSRRQTRRINFWSSQARGERAPYGGPLELRAKWIRQHRRLCLSSFNSKLIKRFRTWTRSPYVFSNSVIPMFFIYSIVMNIICPFRT